MKTITACFFGFLVFSSISMAQTNYTLKKDVVYAAVDKRPLVLDLYLPTDVELPPLVVWVHGGAWSAGSKEDIQIEFVQRGFAMASIGYRLSPEAKFPAQVHDIKAAIRFLRAKAAEYGYQSESIAIAGASAGGHLAALVGVSNGNEALEGTLGDHLDQSSSVQVILDYFGPTNFATILTQSTPHGLSVRIPALELLLGAHPNKIPELAALASPVYHVDNSDPPLLIVHGDQDPQVPINQSHELHGRYKQLGLIAQFEVLHGAAHGGPMFFDEERMDIATAFMSRNLSD